MAETIPEHDDAYRAAWEAQSKDTPGPRSLLDLSLRQAVRDFERYDLHYLQSLPDHLLHLIGEEMRASTNHSRYLRAWVVLATLLPSDQHPPRYHTVRVPGPVSYHKILASTGISSPFQYVVDFVLDGCGNALNLTMDLPNLRSLRILNPGPGLGVSMSNTIFKAMARLAVLDNSPYYQKLQSICMAPQEAFDLRSFRYINCFPSLALFGYFLGPRPHHSYLARSYYYQNMNDPRLIKQTLREQGWVRDYDVEWDVRRSAKYEASRYSLEEPDGEDYGEDPSEEEVELNGEEEYEVFEYLDPERTVASTLGRIADCLPTPSSMEESGTVSGTARPSVLTFNHGYGYDDPALIKKLNWWVCRDGGQQSWAEFHQRKQALQFEDKPHPPPLPPPPKRRRIVGRSDNTLEDMLG